MFNLINGQDDHKTRPAPWQAIMMSLVSIVVLALPAKAVAQSDFADIEASPALFVVEDEDSTVYLFGTFHLLPPALDWRTEAFDAAFDESDTLYLEADVISPETQTVAQALIPQLGFNEPGVTLSSLVSQDALDNVAQFADSIGVPADALITNMEPLKPWLASLQLAVMGIQSAGFAPNAGADIVLATQASEDGKSFGYFETIEEQLRFFADMPMDLQIAQFEVGTVELLNLQDGVTELVGAWATGDLDVLTEVMNGAMLETSPELYDTIIVRRNERWVPEIEAILDGSGTTFIAVGALHLPGEHGVIPLLEEAGYTVSRIQ